MRKYFLILTLTFTAIAAQAGAQEYYYDYNSRCQQAYTSYLSLKINEGDALIRKEFAENPRNLMATYLADYGDFIELLFNGDPAQLKQRQNHQAERLSILARGNSSNPWYRFCRAGIQMHWAVVYGRFGEQFKAATTFRKSYLLIRENKTLFPTFAQNDLFLGVEEAVAGTIPEDYRWLAAIFGMKGNVKKGAARLSSFLDRATPTTALREEAAIYDIYLRFYLLYQQQDAANAANALPPNALNSFFQANIQLNYHNAAAAGNLLRGMMKDPAWGQFPVFEYEFANALYLNGDAACIRHFQQYTVRNKGNLYTKDALMKCALFYYLSGNQQMATEARKQIKVLGNTATDADKQAQRFAEDSNWPNAFLLKARIQTEGGNYREAIAQLKSLIPSSLRDPADKLEYYYRAGRAYEGIDEITNATRYYNLTIKEGSNRKEQFAARACLQTGLMLEKSKRKDEAIQWFKRCLSMRNHDFQSSLDQQAKAGINRLSIL